MEISLYSELYIESTFTLSSDDFETLVFLYQPIIGARALSLYISMYYEAINKSRVVKILHKEICDLLGLTILNYEKERKKLEAVGLIQSYIKDSFYCLLRRPLQPNRLLNETALGSLLRETVGEEMLKLLANKFNCDRIDVSGLTETTKSLDDIYKIEKIDNLNENVRTSKIAKVKKSFNYDQFEKSLKNVLTKDELTLSFKNKIEALAESYSLNEKDMKKVVLCSFDESRSFDITRLNDEAEKLYRINNKNELTVEVSKEVKVEVDSSEKSRIKALILKYFNAVSADNIHLIVSAMEKTGLSMEQIEEMIKEIAINTNGVFPNAKYIDKVATTYIQKGVRANNKKSKTEELYEEYRKNIKEEDISWRD